MSTYDIHSLLFELTNPSLFLSTDMWPLVTLNFCLFLQALLRGLHCKCFSGCHFQICHKLCIVQLHIPAYLSFYFLCNHQRKVFIYSFSGSKIDQILDFWLRAKFVQGSPHSFTFSRQTWLSSPCSLAQSTCFLKLGSLIFFLQSLFIQQEAITHNEKSTALRVHTLQLQAIQETIFSLLTAQHTLSPEG